LFIHNPSSKHHIKALKNQAHIKNGFLEEFLLEKLNYLEKDKYFLYLYNLKNIILPTISESNKCEFTFILGDKIFKYFQLEFTHIKKSYQLFFETYEELVNFYKIFQDKIKVINRPYFLNTKKQECNFDFLQKIDFISKKQERFSIFHKLFDKKLGFTMKVQTFDKNWFKTENYIFLRKIFDTCKFNNFLKLKIFPIANFYENKNNIILEYTDNDYRI